MWDKARSTSAAHDPMNRRAFLGTLAGGPLTPITAARAFGLKTPESLVQRANEVIQ